MEGTRVLEIFQIFSMRKEMSYFQSDLKNIKLINVKEFKPDLSDEWTKSVTYDQFEVSSEPNLSRSFR